MNPRSIACLTSLTLVALTASTQADALLESFETSVYTGPNPPYTSISQSTTAVTDGNYSMQVDFDNSQGWAWLGKTYGAQAYTDWYNHTKLQFDVHREAESFGWNLDMNYGINNVGSGWQQQNAVNWAWLNAGVSDTFTVSWDYSALRAAAPAPGSPNTTWWQFNVQARGGSGGTVYIDNIRFVEPAIVPEPGTVSLLSLGAGLLALGWRARQNRN